MEKDHGKVSCATISPNHQSYIFFRSRCIINSRLYRCIDILLWHVISWLLFIYNIYVIYNLWIPQIPKRPQSGPCCGRCASSTNTRTQGSCPGAGIRYKWEFFSKKVHWVMSPSFLGVISPIFLGPKTFIFPGFGVQRYLSNDLSIVWYLKITLPP